jgi:hypothetical protein
LPLRLTTISLLHSPLPRLTAALGARTLLGPIAVAVLGTLLPLLTPASTGGSLALIGVAIAILSALTLVGVPVAILGTSPLIGIAIAVLSALPFVGAAALGRTTLLSARGARRIVTQAALLARTKRTRRGDVARRPDLGASLAHSRLPAEALTAQVLLAHHLCTPDLGSASQYVRPNIVRPDRPANPGRNVGCRDARVHSKARPAVAHDHRAVDHHRLTEEDRILTLRHDH